MYSCRIFSPLCGLHLHSPYSVLCCTNNFSFIRSHLWPIGLMCWATEVSFRKSSSVPVSINLLNNFPSRSFRPLGLMLKPLIHLEYFVRWEVRIFVHFSACRFPFTICWRHYLFPNVYLWYLRQSSEIGWNISGFSILFH